MTDDANGEPNEAKLVIDQIVSRTARLDIVSRDPRKLPRRFEIHNLVMRGLGDDDGATCWTRLSPT